MINNIQERVQAGAKALDTFNPGWETKVDSGRLDVSCPRSCVLGQLYGSYLDAPRGLRDDGIELGFYADGVRTMDSISFKAYMARRHLILDQIDTEYRELTVAWSDLITRRREEVAAHQELIQQAPEPTEADFDTVIANFRPELAASFLVAV